MSDTVQAIKFRLLLYSYFSLYRLHKIALYDLKDLDYADDIALLSHTHSHIQEKTRRLNVFAKQVGLNISRKKTEVMALNTNR